MERRSYTWIFDCTVVSALNPCVVQELRVHMKEAMHVYAIYKRHTCCTLPSVIRIRPKDSFREMDSAW